MRLVRFESGGYERVGALLDEGIVDLSGAGVSGSMRAALAIGQDLAEAVERARRSSAARHSVSDVRLLAPVGDPPKIICIGQNYRDHCIEQNQPFPERPIIFAKFATALVGPGGPIRLPAISQQVDYEAELAFVIGRRGRHIAESDARRYVAGYMCLNDVSARDIQFGDKQWVRGKAFDSFAPTGPMLVTADEVPDPHTLDIQLTLNGEVMQKSNTSNLIFGVDHLVSFLSAVMTLEPGDIVTTGTPGGVGVFRQPPVFLKPGDEVSISIAGLGTLTNPVVSEN